MSYEITFLKVLATTLSIELIAGLIIRWAGSKFKWASIAKVTKAIPLTKFIAGILFATTLTLPYVWLLFPVLIKNYLAFAIIAELFAFLMEALFYRFFFGFTWKFSLFFSFCLNFTSFSIGLLIFQ